MYLIKVWVEHYHITAPLTPIKSNLPSIGLLSYKTAMMVITVNQTQTPTSDLF